MSDIRVALAGNPNVGKSTIFNALTGMHQHTGNWSGKTVDTAQGTYRDGQGDIRLVDLPGTYSLFSLSPEERIAGEYIEAGDADATVVVCDASSLERNLILVLQVLSLTGRVVVCVNLMDEAKKHGIAVDIPKLSEILGVTVVGTSASSREGLPRLIGAIREAVNGDNAPRFALMGDETVTKAGEIADECTTAPDEGSIIRARRLDRILTGKVTGVPLMLLLLFGVLWITVIGANKPSELLSNGLFYIGSLIRAFLSDLGAHEMLVGALMDGIYNTTAWVVGVMLPPMAIFFPLFTVLEDLGYLPRVAFNLDGVFRRCGSCGKQSLTMCLRQKSVRIKRQIREMLKVKGVIKMKYLLLILLTLTVFMTSCGNVEDTDGKSGNEKDETANTENIKDKASDVVNDATDGASDMMDDISNGASDMMDDVSDAFDKATGAISGEVLGITRLTTDQAQYAALSDAGYVSRDVTFYKTYLHNADGRVYYDVEFATSDAMYDYEIDSLSGDVLKREERTLR